MQRSTDFAQRRTFANGSKSMTCCATARQVLLFDDLAAIGWFACRHPIRSPKQFKTRKATLKSNFLEEYYYWGCPQNVLVRNAGLSALARPFGCFVPFDDVAVLSHACHSAGSTIHPLRHGGLDMNMGAWVAIGTAIGTSIGAAMGNISMGVAIGVGAGAALGAAMSGARRNREEDEGKS